MNDIGGQNMPGYDDSADEKMQKSRSTQLEGKN